MWKALSVCMVLTLASTVLWAGKPEDRNKVIIGAGAHFSWMVFHDLKPELEKLSGHSIELYGQGSLLGVGCNSGIKTALKHQNDAPTFGFTCCPLGGEEVKKKKIRVFPLALEPILIVANRENPVHNLTEDQVKGLFSGRIRNWKAVGGFDKPVVVVARLHCKKRSGHWKTILPSHEDFSPQSILVTSAEDMVEKINQLPNAIGHIGSAWSFKPDHRLQFLSVSSHKPTAENLRSKKYPYFRQLSAVTVKNPVKPVLDIIRYTQTSASFKKVAKRYELLPLN